MVLIERLHTVLNSLPHSCEIIVVDDGSEDSTAHLLSQLSKSLPIRSIRHPKNLGLGAALRTGLCAAMDLGEGVVIVMDADDSHDPALIPEMITKIEQGADVVVGSRFVPGGRAQGVPFYRRALSRAARMVIGLGVRLNGVTDGTSGYRAYRASALQTLRLKLGEQFISENGFASTFELFVKLCSLGVEVVELPMVLRYDRKRGQSKMKVLRTIYRYFVVVMNNSSLVSLRSPASFL